MKVKKYFKYYLTMCPVVFLMMSSPAFSEVLTQSQYDLQVKQAYKQLEMRQLDLNRVLDQKEHPNIIIEKSCIYVNHLKKLEKLSFDNMGLNKAKDEAEFVGGLIQEFDQSFTDLETTYQKSCTK